MDLFTAKHAKSAKRLFLKRLFTTEFTENTEKTF